jgi:membrane AbrB-like protein
VVLSRSGFIAGTSAVWGLSPGAATAMIVMADEFGANWQMVSLMQYTRVILVIMSSVFVVGMGDSLSLPMLVSQLSLFDLSAGLGSAAIVLASLILAHYVKWPAAHLLYPMVLGTVVMKWFDVIYSPPVFVMVVAYLVLGIRIGEGFSRVLIQKFRLILGRLVLAILALISFSLASSYLFALATGIDFKTAYLAFSPGGLDTAALIGASTHVNMNIVMASQSVRMFIVILVAPMMAKFIVRRFALTGEGNKF